MGSGVVPARLARRAVFVAAALCLAALLAPWPVSASADVDALHPVGSWTLVNPWPQASDLNDSASLGPLTAVAVGDKGTIMRTTDGGASWDVSRGPTDADLWASCFPDSEHGWAVGEQGTILTTVDGGRSWNAQESGVDWPLERVTFVDAEHGWTGGSGSHLLRTTDGGATWRQSAMPSAFEVLKVLTFVDRDTGWAAAAREWERRDFLLYKTTDGGATWELQMGLPWSVHDMDWLDSRRGWLLTRKSLYRTVDGGQNWQNVFEVTWGGPYDASPQLVDVEFISATEGLGILRQRDGPAQLWRTEDGGATWLPVFDTPDFKAPTGLTLGANGSGWVVGRQGYLATTTDGGRSWRQVSRDLFADEGGPYLPLFVDVAHGWLIGGSVNLHTADGGKTWRRQPLPFDGHAQRQTAYDFPDAASGWALAHWGRNDYYVGIARTGDGGEHWELITVEDRPADTDPLAEASFPGRAGGLDFFSARNGWVVGSEAYDHEGEDQVLRGLVLHTLDGGRSWIRYRLRRDEYPEGVVATGPRSAVVVGDRIGDGGEPHGFIMSTTDGGMSWSRQDFAEHELGGIDFSDPRTGWILSRPNGLGADGSFLLQTTDGGRTWEEQRSCLGAWGLPVFPDARLGVCRRNVLDAGASIFVSMITTDGGKTWREGEIPGLLPEGLHSHDWSRCAFVTPALRWALGYNHELWRWTPGGAPLSPVLVD